MTRENKYGEWARYFSEGYVHDEYEMLRSTAHHHANNFMRGVREGTIKIEDDFTLVSSNPELDNWVEGNQSLLSNLVCDIQSHIESVSDFALPAHDIRQILLKDAAEALRFSAMEKPQGYKSTFAIPTFAHDIGRLLEGRFYCEENPHYNWIPHAQLSFLLLKEILDKPDYISMPQALKHHFLYAVLAHSGDNGKSYMSRAVQACDRMQLIGAEGFFRAVSYGVCLMNADIKYPEDEAFETDLPDMNDHRSVISVLEYFARNMRENIGCYHLKWRDRIETENIALLMKLSEQDENLYTRIFAPENQKCNYFGARKQPIDSFIMEMAEIVKDGYGCSSRIISRYDVSNALSFALQSPLGAASLTREMQLSLNRAISNLSDGELFSLYDTVSMADALRMEQDMSDREILIQMTDSPHAFCKQIAEKSLDHLPAMQTESGQEIKPSTRPIAPLFTFG